LLETYLRAILTSKQAIWRDSYTFLDFLSVPQNTKQTRQNSSGNIHWTPANWLSEHSSVQSALRGIRSELLKRDALASMGDAAGSRGASVNAKRLIRDVGDKIDVLARGLDVIAAAIGDGEKNRRGEMLDALRNERGDLSRMADVGVRTNRDGAGIAPGSTMTSGSGVMPGASSSLWAPTGSSGLQAAPGRVFGRRPEETDETRPLDDRGVLQSQQSKISTQDDQLKDLSKILQRQRGMGEEIHREIGEQTDMLEEIEQGVDKVGAKMGRAKRTMNKLN
jgi:regulator of vacuolar morphogenesis